MHKAVFTIGEESKAYIGYTTERKWNGWATPHFELEEAIRNDLGDRAFEMLREFGYIEYCTTIQGKKMYAI